MRAISIEQYGGPEVLQWRRDALVPEPGPDDVLVRVAYAGVNFMDIHTRQGKYAASRTYPVRLPCTLGMEGAGRVIAVGHNVTTVKAGDRVAWCIAWGSYADYARIPAARCARLPDSVAYDVAAAAIFQGSTAHYLVQDVAQLQAGATCLIHAASGSIGQLLVQWAKHLGATVYATASNAEKCSVAMARGADAAFLYGDGQFADDVLEATAGRGVDVVFDSVGRKTLRDSFRATRTRGLVVNYGSVSGSLQDLDPIELGESGSLFLTRPRLADHMQDAQTVQRRADAVWAALASGALTMEIAGRYTLETVAQAHERIESRVQIGKAVVEIDRGA
ncbi:quinone oxidoreductase family protein [Achromobacter marplatensis]